MSLGQQDLPTDVAAGRCLTERISVTEPYLALEDIRSPECGSVVAIAPFEHPLGRERGPMGAAEMGRHMAILGSLSVASLNEAHGRHYYLANRARFVRSVGTLEPSALIGGAVCTRKPTRMAKARVELTELSGGPVASLEVGYFVLKAEPFCELFGEHRRPTDFPPLESPYAKELPIKIQNCRARRVRASLDIAPEHCAGHFDGFPAAPVARTMQALTHCAGELLAETLGRPSLEFVVESGTIEAKQLAFAGSRLSLSVEVVRGREDVWDLRCRAAKDDDSDVGLMDLSLRVL